MLYQETEQLRSKVQVMWVNGRILHPLQLEKTIKNSRGWGKYRYSLAQNFHNLQYLPYWQGSKNSSWKTCLAVDETAAKRISDKLRCQRFLSKITQDSWPKSDVWIDNKQNGWNIMRDMFPTKTNPSGTLTRWRNLIACLNSERQTLGVLGDEKINNEIFRCHAQNPWMTFHYTHWLIWICIMAIIIPTLLGSMIIIPYIIQPTECWSLIRCSLRLYGKKSFI